MSDPRRDGSPPPSDPTVHVHDFRPVEVEQFGPDWSSIVVERCQVQIETAHHELGRILVTCGAERADPRIRIGEDY
jgi:hypothetical protein